MNIERALATSDYDCDERRAELRWLAEQASHRQMVVEVGSYKGTTALAMADNMSLPTAVVYCVDTFEGSVGEVEMRRLLDSHPPGWLKEVFLANTTGQDKIRPLVMDSLKAAELLGKSFRGADMIFLDASHDYDSVKADILAWLPALAPGGLLCGHDRQWDGVAQAINDLVPNHRVGAGAIWYRP